MKYSHLFAIAVFSATALLPGTSRAEVLLHEEFDNYTPGSIVGQTGQGLGLTSGTWTQPQANGTYVVGPGLSGNHALVIDSSGRNDITIGHTTAGWGSGQLWMSWLYNEISYAGHSYVSGGPGFEGACGHAWSRTWSINNAGQAISYNLNQTYRVVALLDWDAGTTTMWVDPDPATAPVTDPLDVGFAPTVHKVEKQLTTPTIRITTYCDATVDDIIIGTTYADVAIAVPGDPPVAPSPISPINTATAVSLDEQLRWTPNGAITYDVFLWMDGELKPETASATVTTASYNPGGLNPVTAYHWQIDSTNDNGTTTGATWTFTTNDGVEAVLPPHGVTDVPVNVPLEWLDNGATSWDLYLWKDGETKPGTPTATVTDPSYNPGGLIGSTLYHWEIVSTYDAGSPSTSSTWSFTTSDGVAGQLLLHEEFDGYAPGTIIGQTGLGLGEDGAWTAGGVVGTVELGDGLSGSNGLVVSGGGGNTDAYIAHAVPGWGSGVFYMSCLYNEVSYGGHSYLTGTGSFNGGFGHGWSGVFQINNESNPGNVSYTQGQTYRLVARYDFDANVTTMWVDPVYEFDAPAAIKAESLPKVATLGIRNYNTVAAFDDIRIGTDFASVTREIPSGITAPILRIALNGANLGFSWNSEKGMLYDLVSSPDLSTPISTWPAVVPNEAIAADPSGTNTLSIVRPLDDRYFYALVAYLAPPTVLFGSDFEANDAGLAYVDNSGGAGTPWQWGAPDSNNNVGSIVAAGNGPSAKCWAVGLGDFTGSADNGFYNASTNASLRTPIINLTTAAAATLSFAHAMDVEATDIAEVNFLDADNGDAWLATVAYADDDLTTSAWTTETVAVPAAALGKNIRIEWRLSTTSTTDYIGWYLDDVLVTGD